jgi:uncharacterized damage-inducible protein DinB
MTIKSTEEITTCHDTLVRLFRYKAWADEELLAALAELKPESEVTTLAIKALSHTYVVDRIFIAHLSGIEHAFSSANVVHLPALQDLAAGFTTYLHTAEAQARRP